MASGKVPVFEHLFFVTKGFVAGQPIQSPIVTEDEIDAAIAAMHAQGDTRLQLSANRANFYKDITRRDPNAYWPANVLAAGYTAEDAIGDGPGAIFKFTALPPGQTVAFSDAPLPSSTALASPVILESVSMPLATKALGRSDENWLAQVGVRLRVIESHFARSMSRRS